MGLYRLFLAAVVAIAHACGYSVGVVAVISFFILSGYVMTLSIEKYYKQKSAIKYFYIDRFARLFPQFICYMLLYSACIYFLKIEPLFVDINNLSFSKWLLNFFIVPQGYYMYWLGDAVVIPQTWSLGLELTFYLLIPWLLIYLSSLQIYWLSFFSFLIFFAAYLGEINSDYFGYRLLPGTLFIFLIGWSFFLNDKRSKLFRSTIFTVCVVLLFFTYLKIEIYQRPYIKEVLFGLIIGIVATTYMKHFTFSKVDEFLGNLSYGVFLNHIIIISIMSKYFAVNKFDFASTTMLLLVSGTGAYISFLFVERPALKLRHAIRYKAIAQGGIK